MCICYAVRPHAVLCDGKASFDGSAAASAIFPTASELAEEDARLRPAPAASAALVPTLSTPLALSARPPCSARRRGVRGRQRPGDRTRRSSRCP